MGNGYGTRHNAEDCWLGRRGKPQRKSKGVRELIVAPVREHSRKPDEVYQRIEALCAGPYVELFRLGQKNRTWRNPQKQKTVRSGDLRDRQLRQLVERRATVVPLRRAAFTECPAAEGKPPSLHEPLAE